MAEILATYKYTLNSDGVSYSIQCNNKSECTNAIIPSEYNGLPVTTITDWAFSDCTQLTTVYIPETITSIQQFAFLRNKLSDIVVSQNNTNYYSQDGVLYYIYGQRIYLKVYPSCRSESKFIVPDCVTDIGWGSFEYSQIESIVLSDSVLRIAQSAFNECTSLKSVILSKNLVQLGMQGFSGCTALETIKINEGISSIPTDCFRNCSSLHSVQLPSTLKQIDSSAFYKCTNLHDIVITANVEKISTNAFKDCSKLETITLLSKTPASLTNANAFSNIHTNAKFYCTSDSIELYKTATNWKSYADKFTTDDMRIYFAMNSVAQKNYFASKEEVNNLLEINIILKSQITELQNAVNNLQDILASMRPATSEAISTVFNTEA